MEVFFLTLVLLVNFFKQSQAYCWEPGRNPGFSGPPIVEQIDLSRVRVSWEGLVFKRECADQMLVKYWQRSNPQQYDTTNLLDKNVDSVIIKVIPKVDYQFQAVAREDKGAIGGVDWNKSPIVDFKTSAFNPEISLEPDSGKVIGTAQVSSAEKKSPSGDEPSKNDQNTGYKVDPDTQKSALPLSIEILAIAVVGSIALLLIVIGVAYKLFCIKKPDLDAESVTDDEENPEKERLDSTSS